MPTKLIKCACVHPYQDQLYGQGVRVGNEMRTGQVKCSVCGTIGGTKGVFVSPKTQPTEKAPEPVKEKGKKVKEPTKGKHDGKSGRVKTPKAKMGKK